ncbi:hypothetical protein GE061_016788 [Apolygus lucorum]|uniref:Uncharacterized protein n=1 Tax=Apolygus lucorum TaxID=248454 RepID=A0A6A4JXI3_APOLU|nr:hypothetical protein GE061_016788 [Apolygus lucorum]
MEFKDFLDLKTLVATSISNRKIDQAGDPVNWLKVKSYRFYRKEDPSSIGYRYDFSGDYKVISVGTPKKRRGSNKTQQRNLANPPPALYKKRLPISAAKKRDLIQLCRNGVNPKNFHSWFENLPSSSATKNQAPEPDIAS